MADRNSGFRIGPEEEAYRRRAGSAMPSSAGTDRRRLEKVNRRLTWLAVLLPLLVAVAVGLAYFDLRNRTDGGGPEADFATAEQVTALREELAALEQTVQDKESPMNEAFLVFERTTASLQEDLRTLGIRIDQLKTGKAEIADLETARKALEERIQTLSERYSAVVENLTPLQENLTALGTSVGNLQTTVSGLEEQVNTQIAEQTAGLAETQMAISNRLDETVRTSETLKAELDQLAEQVIAALKVVENRAEDRGNVDAAISAQRREMDQTVTTLNREINANDARTRSLRRDLDALQRRVESLARQQQRPLGTPPRGGVLEQDLN
jgi:chromosome segregation ATPase